MILEGDGAPSTSCQDCHRDEPISVRLRRHHRSEPAAFEGGHPDDPFGPAESYVA